MTSNIVWIAPLGVLCGAIAAALFYRDMLRQDPGDERMRRIGDHVHSGAMAYLGRQYRVMGVVFVCIAALFAVRAFCIDAQSAWLPLTFLSGGLCSALAGYLDWLQPWRQS